ncbi:MAG: nucleic acid-binding protein [Euryarchaeota archaeon]|nr:nucleic acid-binding protein [Euryarchaeota archaeon]
MRFILDTSAVLSGLPLPQEGELLLPPLVERELGHAWARRGLEYLKEVRLAVREPSRAAIEAVRAKCRGTGDDARLSEADLEVLALALETSGTILTDDYSIQNTASVLGLPYKPVSQKGIREVFAWTYRCTGCRKLFDQNLPECPVCGAELKSHRARR